MLGSKIKMVLNNNPKCETTLVSIPKNEIWEMKNVPYAIVSGENFENGNKSIKVSIDKKKLYEGIIEVKNNCFNLRIELDKPLNSPKKAEVFFENKEYELPIKLKRLYGTVKYYDGTPVERPVIDVTGKDIVAIGDEEGRFEINICGKEQQIGVFEKDYSKKTLESWIYNINLKEDTRLDIKIDKLEVYSINMWEGEMSDYIHFIPMSLVRVRQAMKQEFENELELLGKEELWPKLSKKDVRIYANEDEVKVLTFQEVEDFLSEYDGKVYTRPSYIISIPKGHKDKVVKIEIESESEFVIDGKIIEEKGEGYYFWG